MIKVIALNPVNVNVNLVGREKIVLNVHHYLDVSMVPAMNHWIVIVNQAGKVLFVHRQFAPMDVRMVGVKCRANVAVNLVSVAKIVRNVYPIQIVFMEPVTRIDHGLVNVILAMVVLLVMNH